ncbi:CMRF-35-like molecule 4 [Rattus norvegicus]|uniref:CD300c molecule like 1 n=1 Tax=Rattus norvegicus TaxID=10116 RepID=M0R3P5_RAT|nr:CMRF-35-like molecule 4 [Rattus norvegicus]
MIRRGIGLWLPSVLLLSRVPGCVPLRGPSSVTGTEGESLSVTCPYEERFKSTIKYWCRGSLILLCEDIVMTRGSEEARNGRVSIRDDPDNLTFTVTLQSLTLEDTGTYMCGVGTPFPYHPFGNKMSFRVEVSVVPGSSPGSSIKILEPTRSTASYIQPSVTTNETIPAPSPQTRSLLSSLYFWVLVFLELPLFLCMISAVLWVNRP